MASVLRRGRGGHELVVWRHEARLLILNGISPRLLLLLLVELLLHHSHSIAAGSTARRLALRAATAVAALRRFRLQIEGVGSAGA